MHFSNFISISQKITTGFPEVRFFFLYLWSPTVLSSKNKNNDAFLYTCRLIFMTAKRQHDTDNFA